MRKNFWRYCLNGLHRRYQARATMTKFRKARGTSHFQTSLIKRVEPVPGEGPPDPDIKVEEEHDLDQVPGEPREPAEEGQGLDVRERRKPAAEEQDHDQGRDEDHVGVLGDVEESEFHPRVLCVVAGHELRFGLGQVERGPVGLGDPRDPEDDERDRQEEAEPDPGVLLVVDDGDEVHGPAEEDNGQHGQAEGDLVAQDLDDRPQGSHQGILGIRSPASEDDPEDARSTTGPGRGGGRRDSPRSRCRWRSP